MKEDVLKVMTALPDEFDPENLMQREEAWKVAMISMFQALSQDKRDWRYFYGLECEFKDVDTEFYAGLAAVFQVRGRYQEEV